MNIFLIRMTRNILNCHPKQQTLSGTLVSFHMSGVTKLNPIALKMAETPQSFGHCECIRVKPHVFNTELHYLFCNTIYH